MGKLGHRRSASQDEDNVGCVWGLMRMLYFRRDPKFLLDTKQLSARHIYREINGEFSPLDTVTMRYLLNTEECTLQRPTVKNLIEDELGKVKLLKKIPSDDIQRRLSDLGNDVALDMRSKQENKPTENLYHRTDPGVPLSQSVDSEVSHHAERYDLESVLTNMLGEIYSCHSECPHGDCKNRNELCPSLKSLIRKKVNDLNNLPRNVDHGPSQESNDGKLLNHSSLSNTTAAQSKQLKDALEILSSNKELFLKLLQKPNSNTVDDIQKNQKVKDGLKPNKTSSFEDRRSSSQHGWATKEQAKESRYMFFWRKDKSNRRQIPETTNGAQTVSKIVILKPNPERGIDQKANNSTRSLHQECCKSHTLECSGKGSSKFSIKEVKKRFRIVTEGSLAENCASSFKNDVRPLINSKEKQQIGSTSDFSGHTVGPKDDSFFYEEAKRHLSEMLKEKDGSISYPTVQFPKSLEGILSLPHRNVSTPVDSPRRTERLDVSPEEKDVCHTSKVQIEECTQERSQSLDRLGLIACSTSAALTDQVTVHEGCFNEAQEGPRHVTHELKHIEGIDKFDCQERIGNTECIPAEQCRDDAEQGILEETEQGKEPVQMSLVSAENIIEQLEQQEPETPEPRTSSKLSSHGSPEQSNENKEKPSPVSVLESFFEDIASPDCINKKEYELSEDVHRTLYFGHDVSDVKVIWEDRNARLDYIKLVLELSELCAEQNLEVWYLEDELISPCLFEELPNQGDQIDDLKLLFDCICEALTEVQERYFRLSSWLSFLKHDIRTPPLGENLITEVERYVSRYIQYSGPSTNEQIIKRDLETQSWMDIRSKTEGIIMEIWEFVLDELIDESVFDLWI
ncbi:hypothetical protein PR202_gb07383 [Eleusine coracana subsp. coracana]|uniref:DUF4378 domain-containing protein n=1 Tax=Eleusine coracana subsp. coracana TaxID=191504 RepID=A0AAV5EB99_ELECO|nr:hypothetical protein PR202_gb07383 [Eleusine coracana subsp. coracana]